MRLLASVGYSRNHGSGEVYSFGQGIFGALGSGNMENSNIPIGIEELWGLGIIQVTNILLLYFYLNLAGGIFCNHVPWSQTCMFF